MADAQFNREFSPAEATRGSWVPLDSSTITDLPSSSRGRYAQLSYIMGSEPGSLSVALSGGTVILPVSTVNITEPVQVENYPGDALDVTVTVPDTVYVESLTLSASETQSITFGSTILTIEIYNNSGANTIYYLPYLTTGATVSADGLPITNRTYYSMDRDIDSITLFNGGSTNTDVRVLGHYRA